MKVGFGTTVLAECQAQGGVDGIGSYTKELAGELSKASGLTLVPVGFGFTPSDSIFSGGVRAVGLGRYAPQAGWGAISPLGFKYERLLRGQIDLFHATDHLIPKFSNIPVLATLMDAIPLSHPAWVRMRFASVKRWLWRRAGHWADHIVTISEYSKRAIVENFDISPNKISVTPLGVNVRFFERIEPVCRQNVLRRLDLPEQFLLFVGTLQPRKNLERALDAHAALPVAMQAEVPLVVVGRTGWGCETLVARLSDPQIRATVRWLHYLPDFEVRCLLQTARALVFPSLCEGFGLPVVEAFASGLPVITSNTTSLPEVAGDAALLINPNCAGEITDAMRQVILQDSLSDVLRKAGLRRAHELSWQDCANKTLSIYQKVLSG